MYSSILFYYKMQNKKYTFFDPFTPKKGQPSFLRNNSYSFYLFLTA